MQILLLALGTIVFYLAAYHTYGRWLGRRIFELSAKRVCPSASLRDDADYVPTPRLIVFGHHFTSIAGTGPIVGPAIGVIWGWLPALLWVLLGSVFVGAVHDLGALVVSLRNEGKSVGELAGRIVGPRVRGLFMWILAMSLTLVLAVFGLVITAVFRQFPMAIFPCLVQIPLSLIIGGWLHRKGGSIGLAPFVALGVMYLSVLFGDVGWLHAFNTALASMPVWAWTALLLAYCYAASVLPVWLLLQPRDFINSLQLLSVLGLLVLGLGAAGLFGGAAGESGVRPSLEFAAPMVRWNPEGAPQMFPFLFITIACGAVSGFHCLVSSGTSSKQLKSEADASFVGYGAMLTEGFLAMLVILACAAGLGLGFRLPDGTLLEGTAAWTHQYASWGRAESLAASIGAFVAGAGNFLSALGIPRETGIALMGVFIASFAGTTMDSACRLQRYVVQEVFTPQGRESAARSGGVRGFLRSSHGATLLAVTAAGLLASMPPTGLPWTLENAGKGGMTLWPLFGATNQLVAGIAFIVITFYVRSQGKPIWFLLPPMMLMLAMPLWAMQLQLSSGSGGQPGWIHGGNLPLVIFAVATVLLQLWLATEAVLIWRKTQRRV